MKTKPNITFRKQRRPGISFGVWNSAFGVRPGFTFIEVLFAVVILGVGLIMIAGMLPVAIKQNADTRNDLTAKVVCDSGYAYIRALIQNHPEAFPETCGDRGVNLAANINFGGEPFAPVNNSLLYQFMGDQLMGLNDDNYTPQGTTPQSPTDGDRMNAGILRAGRMMPLSYDVAYPAGTLANGGYDIGNLIENQAWNDSTNPVHLVKHHPAASEYPLGWHQTLFGDRIISSEPRFQWLAFYRRDEGSRVIVAMRQQTTEVTDRYDASKTMIHEQIADPTVSAGTPVGNGPFLVPIQIEDSLTGPDKVKFVGTAGTNAWDIDVAETGSFLIVAHSPPDGGPRKVVVGTNVTYTDTGDLNRPFRNNGRIFRLAARRDDLDSASNGRVWELAPGYDVGPADAGPDQIVGTPDDIPDGSMNPVTSFAENKTPETSGTRQTAVSQYQVSNTDTVAGTTTWAWIIGRGHVDPTTGSGAYVGATQDLGVLSVDVPMP
jgi:prepilin-type N-terminal cleavage/methylation domain-containing protein